jgi:hypothetical protein
LAGHSLLLSSFTANEFQRKDSGWPVTFPAQANLQNEWCTPRTDNASQTSTVVIRPSTRVLRSAGRLAGLLAATNTLGGLSYCGFMNHTTYQKEAHYNGS